MSPECTSRDDSNRYTVHGTYHNPDISFYRVGRKLFDYQIVIQLYNYLLTVCNTTHELSQCFHDTSGSSSVLTFLLPPQLPSSRSLPKDFTLTLKSLVSFVLSRNFRLPDHTYFFPSTFLSIVYIPRSLVTKIVSLHSFLFFILLYSDFPQTVSVVLSGILTTFLGIILNLHTGVGLESNFTLGVTASTPDHPPLT